MMPGRLVISLVLIVVLKVSFGNAQATGNLRGERNSIESGAFQADEQIEMPDETGSFDHIGPYQEEPNSTDAQHPQPAMQNWTGEILNSSEPTFCAAHKTGYWCNGFTRVRCCMLEGTSAYAKCGSTANSSSCGWQSPVVHEAANSTLSVSWWDSRRRRSWNNDWSRGGSGWHIHPGWHRSSFCESHHVGRFCSSHHVIHCCNDYGHYVECNSAYRYESWC